MITQVPFFRHGLAPRDAEKVANVLATPILTSGPIGKSVEAQISEFFGLRYAGLTNSWTNGALAALMAMDVGPGDEVLVPAMTFIASANVAEILGAKPVFVDVEPDTLLMSLERMKHAITPRSKAVMPVHLYGQMLDMRSLREALADVGRSDIRVMEDCAHCFEGRYDDYGPGELSDIAIFSFYATKNITCGEGGAYITNSEDLQQKMLQTRLHGMSAGAADRYQKGSYRHWDMQRLGGKANLPDLLAALLPDQIVTIRDALPIRQALAERYEQAFADLPIRIASVSPRALSARHAFPIHVPPAVRDDAIEALNRAGVGVAVNFRSAATMTYYREKYGYGEGDFPVSHEWGAGEITLPLYPSLQDEEQAYVIQAVREKVAPLCLR